LSLRSEEQVDMKTHEKPRPVRARAIVFVAAAIGALGCGTARDRASDSAAGAAATTPAPADSATRSPSAASMAMLDVAKLSGGAEYLVDAEGRSVYVFSKDAKGKGGCVDACAAAWPPVTTNGPPMAHSGAIASDKLGTIARSDGATQVTYAGKPLYFFAKDHKTGDVGGQDLKEFGGEWYLVKPSGEKQEAKK
jgi:predicted lipoprotein with Yx(FWY)xxD motif